MLYFAVFLDLIAKPAPKAEQLPHCSIQSKHLQCLSGVLVQEKH